MKLTPPPKTFFLNLKDCYTEMKPESTTFHRNDGVRNDHKCPKFFLICHKNENCFLNELIFDAGQGDAGNKIFHMEGFGLHYCLSLFQPIKILLKWNFLPTP